MVEHFYQEFPPPDAPVAEWGADPAESVDPDGPAPAADPANPADPAGSAESPRAPAEPAGKADPMGFIPWVKL
jgi:hypothetical protein